MNGIEVMGFNIEADPPSVAEGAERRIRVIVRLKRLGEGKPITVRIPIEIQSIQGRWRKRVMAVGVFQELVTHGVGDVELPLGDYAVISVPQPSVRTLFRLRRAPHPPTSLCDHSRIHPTEITTLVEAEGRETPIMGMQEMLMRQCCQGHIPFWNTSRKDLYELGIYYSLKGTLRLNTNGQEQIVRQGEYLVESPASRVELSPRQIWPVHFRHAFFPSHALRRLRDELGLERKLGIFDFSSDLQPVRGGVAQALELWESAYLQTPGFGRQELLEMAGRWLLVRLLQEHPNSLAGRKGSAASNHEDPRLLVARQELELRFNEPVSMKAVASKVGTSVRSLNRLFQVELGLTPKAYLQQVRIEHAKRLIRGDGKSLQEISSAVGYRDLRTFRRIFKRHLHPGPQTFH